MKTLASFQEALEYVNRLGFAGAKGPGWIPVAQGRMCDVIDALECAASGTTVLERKAKHEEIFRRGEKLPPDAFPYPFRVRFHRPTGYLSGVLRHGSFTVEKNGVKTTVECSSIRSL